MMRAESIAKAQIHDFREIEFPKSISTALRGSLSLASFDAILMPTLAHATTICVQYNHTAKWLERLVSQTICWNTTRFAVGQH
jgi:hypothetical protein